MEVPHERPGLSQVRQLVIVGGEQRPGPQPRAVVDVLGHGPGDRKPIESRGSAADLVQQEQASGCGLPQDRGCLAHLHHEGALTARERVLSPDPGEDLVDHPDSRAPGGDEGPDLCEQDDQPHLPQQGRLAGHIGSRQDDQARILRIEPDVVRNEPFPRVSLHHGMPPGFDLD